MKEARIIIVELTWQSAVTIILSRELDYRLLPKYSLEAGENDTWVSHLQPTYSSQKLNGGIQTSHWISDVQQR